MPSVSGENRLIEYRNHIDKVRNEIAKVMIGQRDVIDQMLWAVFAGGHALLEGVPGLGKTLLVRTLAEAFELSFRRIQFTPDLMPADILGTNILQVDEEGRQHFSFQQGPIFAHVVLADEINRATPKTQSAMLEAMQEHTVSVGGVTRPLPEPFFVLATQNPLENEGTYPLPEAQLDRFMIKIDVPFPTESELQQIVSRTTSAPSNNVEKVADGSVIQEIQRAARDILIADRVIEYAVKLLLATHPGDNAAESVRKYVRAGAGPRGVQAMVTLAKVRALCDGRYNVAFEDITAVILPALRHRIFLNFEGEANGIRTDEIIRDILQAAGNEK
ncbi:AAA family ATPase [Aneurinibacillus tyrosinisolvens]|uniref:AAA family ATPase n=1 Tax=Aneurinibacillus tyrosinisolvens TaxID=1443435 RepID=UPI00063FB354|nr:MoxR family ATPase [Aneurinibacillus tyrosinisolvens]